MNWEATIHHLTFAWTITCLTFTVRTAPDVGKPLGTDLYPYSWALVSTTATSDRRNLILLNSWARWRVSRIMAASITALANLVLFVALGVDFPVLWCLLAFFMTFIPSVGFVISLVPPVLVALIMLGWKRAVLVVVGLIIISSVVEYVIQPMFMKKGLRVSFLERSLYRSWFGDFSWAPGEPSSRSP